MSSEFETLQQVIRRRKTDKVLGDVDKPLTYTSEQLLAGDQIVKQAIRDAGNAPFHYDRKADGLAEPWRAYWIDNASCLRLAKRLPELIPQLKSNNKMPALLSACGSLTLITWLPQATEITDDSGNLARVNREHLAATAAVAQSFLLLLTAANIPNYWASGTLIADHLFESLGIPTNEVLTAAIFAHYPIENQADQEAKRRNGSLQFLAGKQRARRSADQGWMSEITFGT